METIAVAGKPKRVNLRIVVITLVLLTTGILGLVVVFVVAFENDRVAAGRQLPATASSPYGCCRVTTVFNKNQVSVYFYECELKVREGLTFRSGDFTVLSVDEISPFYYRPIKAADVTRGFFLNLTVNNTSCNK